MHAPQSKPLDTNHRYKPIEEIEDFYNNSLCKDRIGSLDGSNFLISGEIEACANFNKTGVLSGSTVLKMALCNTSRCRAGIKYQRSHEFFQIENEIMLYYHMNIKYK